MHSESINISRSLITLFLCSHNTVHNVYFCGEHFLHPSCRALSQVLTLCLALIGCSRTEWSAAKQISNISVWTEDHVPGKTDLWIDLLSSHLLSWGGDQSSSIFHLSKNSLSHFHNGHLVTGSPLVSFRRREDTSPVEAGQRGKHNPVGSSFTLGWRKKSAKWGSAEEHSPDECCLPQKPHPGVQLQADVERTVPTASYKPWNSILASLNIDMLTTRKINYDLAIKFIRLSFFFFCLKFENGKYLSIISFLDV